MVAKACFLGAEAAVGCAVVAKAGFSREEEQVADDEGAGKAGFLTVEKEVAADGAGAAKAGF